MNNPLVLGPDVSWWRCSHTRAIQYYLHSITEESLFPARVCDNETECWELGNSAFEDRDRAPAHMGERAIHFWNHNRNSTTLYQVAVADCSWTFETHSPVDGCV